MIWVPIMVNLSQDFLPNLSEFRVFELESCHRSWSESRVITTRTFGVVVSACGITDQATCTHQEHELKL